MAVKLSRDKSSMLTAWEMCGFGPSLASLENEVIRIKLVLVFLYLFYRLSSELG
jgi:hypothetical protein